MDYVRNIVRQVLNEMLDKKIRPEYKCDNFGDISVCKFIHKEIEYGVVFTKFDKISSMYVKDENITNIIENAKNKYYSDFGEIKDNKIIYSATNLNQQYDVLNSVTIILEEFIINNDVEIIGYFSDGIKKKIYKYIFDKYLKDDFIYYPSLKEDKKYPTYLIKNYLFKKQ